MENTHATEKMSKNRLTDLSNEMLFSRILLDRDSLKWLFGDLLPGEYMMLVMTEKMEKAYLQSLNYLTQYGIPAISRMARHLKEKGYVVWTHDGDGSEGTYLMLTNSGKQQLENMEEMTTSYYARVIDQFGEDKCREFASMARRMAELLKDEMKDQEADGDDNE